MSRRKILLYSDVEEPKPSKKTISLLPHQRDHFDRLLNIFQESKFANDVSNMGRGKTIVSAAIALAFNMHFFVVAPNSEPWDKLSNNFELNGLFMGCISYAKLVHPDSSHMEYGGVSHRLISKSIVNGETIYTPTDTFRRLAEGPPILFIFDESQSVKNKGSGRSQAVSTITSYIMRSPSQCRLLFLSASMFDDVAQIRSFLKIFGIVTSSQMLRFDPSTRRTNYEGFQELLNYCNYIDKEETTRIYSSYPKITSTEVDDISAELYIKIIHSRVTSEMPDNIPKRNFRLFINITEESDRIKFFQSVKDIKTAANYNEATDDVGTLNVELMTQAIMAFTESIAPDQCRAAIQYMRANPKMKVVFYIQYIRAIDIAIHFMQKAGYKCIKITGEMKPSDRLGARKEFLESSDVNCLFMSIGVGSQSLDLHCISGDYTIVSFCTPNYRLIDTFQASGRSNRSSQLSLPWFFLVYPFEELSGVVGNIFNKLHKKGAVVASTKIMDQSPDNFPGSYPRFFEGFGFLDEKAKGISEMDPSVLIQSIKDTPEKFMPINYETPTLEEISGMDRNQLREKISEVRNVRLDQADIEIDNVRKVSTIIHPLTTGEIRPFPVQRGFQGQISLPGISPNRSLLSGTPPLQGMPSQSKPLLGTPLQSKPLLGTSLQSKSLLGTPLQSKPLLGTSLLQSTPSQNKPLVRSPIQSLSPQLGSSLPRATPLSQATPLLGSSLSQATPLPQATPLLGSSLPRTIPLSLTTPLLGSSLLGSSLPQTTPLLGNSLTQGSLNIPSATEPESKAEVEEQFIPFSELPGKGVEEQFIPFSEMPNEVERQLTPPSNQGLEEQFIPFSELPN